MSARSHEAESSPIPIAHTEAGSGLKPEEIIELRSSTDSRNPGEVELAPLKPASSTTPAAPAASPAAAPAAAAPASGTTPVPAENTEPEYFPYGARVDWNIPPLRKGCLGVLDYVAGPGFTTMEGMVPLVVVVIALTFVIWYNLVFNPDWGAAKRFWSAFFAVNMAFGTAVSTNALKRWYHKKGSEITGWNLVMVALDGIGQTFICNWVFLDDLNNKWYFLVTIGGYLIWTFTIFTFAPLYLKRPVNVGSYMILILLANYAFPRIPGLEWYPYVIFTKYLSHLPREEPYRPSLLPTHTSFLPDIHLPTLSLHHPSSSSEKLA